MIPIMTIEAAKNWKGEAYDTVFIVGKPLSSTEPGGIDVPALYHAVGVNTAAVLEGGTVFDATGEDIEAAREILIHAVLAVRNLIVNHFSDEFVASLPFSNDKMKNASFNTLRDVRSFAEQPFCFLPMKIMDDDHGGVSNQRKPVCVVHFAGNNVDENTNFHPAPDPLLLVVKAATVWGQMTNHPLLANGSEPDSNMTEGDYIAEAAYCDSVFGEPKRAETWQELAEGLGQPYGYGN